MGSTVETTVWHVKLPAEWKTIFDKIAKKEGDNSHGAATRQLRRIFKPKVEDLKEGAGE